MHRDIRAQYSVKAHLETLVRQIMIKNCRCNVTFVIFEDFDAFLSTYSQQRIQMFSRKHCIAFDNPL